MSTPKVLTLSLMLLSGLAAAQNTVSAPSPPTASTTIIDVPASHWARDAVTLLVSRGVLKGFPDGTFRGDQPLTRYQAAVMLAGVLGTPQLTQVAATLTPDQTTVLVNGLQDLAAQIATIATRQTDSINATDDINTRLKKVETVVEQIVAVGATRTDVEAAMTTLRSELASKAEVAGLQDRLSSLETDQVAREAQATEQAAKAASQAEAASTPSLPAPAALPNVTFKPDAPSRYDIGVGISKPLSSAGLGLNVNFLAKNIVGRYGALITGSYATGDQNLSMQANITRAFDGRLVTPYVGAGVGVLGSPTRTPTSAASQPVPSDTNTSDGTTSPLPTTTPTAPTTSGNSYDVFGSVLGGVDYAFTDVVSLFAEMDAHYFLSRGGSGISNSPLGLSVRGGVRIHF